MKIVTYARVSTIGQERKGQSLPNQERAFLDYLERHDDLRLRAYSESASAKSVAGRAEFGRMIADLAELKPDAIVVDNLDRFTRSLREGLNILEDLRGHGVGLMPLDWQRRTPINVDDDRDWGEVVEEFTLAERERRKIGRRVKRAYEGRRERGATTVYHPAFGLLKRGDHLVPDPDNAWIIQEADQRRLQGESMRCIVNWIGAVTPGKLKTPKGLQHIQLNTNFVTAGVRTPEVQQQLNLIYARTSSKYGRISPHAHELTGVIACSRCLKLGYAAEKSLLWGVWMKTNQKKMLVCRRRRHPDFYVTTDRVEPMFVEFLDQWQADPATLERWAADVDMTASAAKAHALKRRLSDLEQQQAALKARRDAAFDMVANDSRALANQARKALLEVEQDERTLHVQMQALTAELSAVALPRRRDPAEMAQLLSRTRETYAMATAAERNELARALCAALGSNPCAVRTGRLYNSIKLEWPEVCLFEVRRVQERQPKLGRAAVNTSSTSASRITA